MAQGKLPLETMDFHRICLIKPSALGDVVQTLPVLSMLRRRFPAAHISWVVKSGLADILRGHSELDELIEYDTPRGAVRKTAALARLLRQLRRRRFDLAVDLQGLFRSGLMTWATRAARRVGFANAREGAPLAYTDRFDVPIMQPALERYRKIAAELGCEGDPPRAIVPIADEHRRFAEDRLATLPRPLLVVHPGAQWETKRWPPQYFARLAQRAQEEFGAGVALVGGPGEGTLCRQVAEELPRAAVDLSEQTTSRQLAAVIERADVFLSGDTGPMHLAAAVGTTVVAVFTCTAPVRAAPRGEQHRVVTTQVPCAASYLKKCPHLICMDDLQPQRVWPDLAAKLTQSSHHAPRDGRVA